MRIVTLPSAWWPIARLRNRLWSHHQPPSSPVHGSSPSDVRPQQQSCSPFPAGPFWSPSPGAIPAACLRTCWWNSPSLCCAGSVRSCVHPAGLWGSCASSRCYWWRLGRHSEMGSRQMGKDVGIRRNTDQAYFEHLNGMRCGCYTGIYCEHWGGGLGSRDLAPEVNTCPPRTHMDLLTIWTLPLFQHPRTLSNSPASQVPLPLLPPQPTLPQPGSAPLNLLLTLWASPPSPPWFLLWQHRFILGLLQSVESESESCSVVSNSLQPHGLYSPWNSPGQNTGVGSLSLLQGITPLIHLYNRVY